MTVAQIVEGDAPGGTERLVIQIALELRRRGHEVVVVGPAAGPGKGWLGDEIRSRGLVYDTIPKRHMLDLRAILDIVRIIRRYDVATLHSHEFAPTVFGALGCWLTRRTHVATMHSNLYFATARRRRTAFRWAVRHSAAVVAVSADTRDDAEKALALSPGTIHLIPNGIASQAGRREPLRHQLKLADSDLLVVALGNVSPRKAHILLVRSMIELKARRPGLKWHLAISGSDQGCSGEIRQTARDNGLEDRVHLLGHRSDTEDVLAAADIFAMSSLHEGMPLAIMEAMFAGKPVISSRAGGIGEMLTDGVDGLLTPVGDAEAMSRALEKVLTDTALRDRLAVAGRRRAEAQFSIGTMMDAYLRLYQLNRV